MDDDIKAKVQDLGERLFRAAIPNRPLAKSIDNQTPSSATESERVQAAVEILHVWPTRYGTVLVGKVLGMPRGYQQVRSIEKISPVFNYLTKDLQRNLYEKAYSYLVDEKSIKEERLEANKFMTIARDSMWESEATSHKILSRYFD